MYSIFIIKAVKYIYLSVTTAPNLQKTYGKNTNSLNDMWSKPVHYCSMLVRCDECSDDGGNNPDCSLRLFIADHLYRNRVIFSPFVFRAHHMLQIFTC